MIRYGIAPVAVVATATTMGITTTPFMGLATLAYGAMVWGYWERKNRYTHMRLMLFAIILDLTLVVTLELQRQAVETAISMSMGPLQQSHIIFSLIATILYFPILLGGFYLWKNPGPSTVKTWHMRLGKAAFLCRSLGFLLMFTLLFQAKN